MTAVSVIEPFGDANDFAEYEQNVYEKHQEMAEREIIAKLNEFLLNLTLLDLLKQYGAQCACRFTGYREITIRLKSGRQWKVSSPVFYRAAPKKKPGKSLKRQKESLRHLGLELLGVIKRISPALVEICVSMAVLCPSFEVAANALRGLGVAMNEHLLQNITQQFAKLARSTRAACHDGEDWRKSGLKILVCVDGGRIRERRPKRGRRKNGQKKPGYSTDWFEPRLLSINQFDEAGKKVRTVDPIIDGSCGSLDDFFELLKQHLLSINLDDAAEIVFCADGGKGIWPRTEQLISELNLNNAKQILDYTHAKQNISTIKQLISNDLKLSDKENRKLNMQIRNLLWNGNIDEIINLVKKRVVGKKRQKGALKKLNEYFGNHAKFQYKTFQDNGLPTGSGSIESAIRRVINLRIKGAGSFWKREHAENMILLRSLVLTGKIRNACRKALGEARNTFDNNMLKSLSPTA